MVYSRLVELSYHTKIPQRRLRTMSDNIIQLNQELIHNELKDLVRMKISKVNSTECSLNRFKTFLTQIMFHFTGISQSGFFTDADMH